jgi:hypothetical protein
LLRRRRGDNVRSSKLHCPFCDGSFCVVEFTQTPSVNGLFVLYVLGHVCS